MFNMAEARAERNKKAKGFYKELQESEFKGNVNTAKRPSFPDLYDVKQIILGPRRGQVGIMTVLLPVTHCQCSSKSIKGAIRNFCLTPRVGPLIKLLLCIVYFFIN